MKKNDLLHFYRNFQIIDVTKQCKFEWRQEPSSCKAYLEVSSASGDFSEGETITGQTSRATATVFSSYVDGGRVYVEDVSGAFQTGETIQGQSSGQTATVDSFVEERSYPDNVIRGGFPNSVVSRDIDDYLEWESSLSGAGFSAYFDVTLPSNGIYSFICLFGVGECIDSFIQKRKFEWRSLYTLSQLEEFGIAQFSTDFDGYIANKSSPSMIYLLKNQKMRFLFYQLGKGTFRWRIHSIRVFKILV